MAGYLALLILIALERLLELARSRRNAAWAFARGGIEVGRTHFRFMTVLHTLFLPACPIVVPGLPVVRKGPYRFVRHPNYVAVILEGLAVPLVHGAWLTAAGFTLLNFPLLAIRIRCEEAALAEHSDYARMADVPRFVPRPH